MILPPVIPDRALLETQALVTLAVRATDEIVGNGPSAGAAEDLREATRIVAAVHGSFGLRQNLVHRVDPGEAGKWVRYDAKAAALIEDDLRRLMRRATVLVRRLGPAIREVAAALLARRTLTGEEVTHLAGHLLPAALPPMAEQPTGPTDGSGSGRPVCPTETPGTSIPKPRAEGGYLSMPTKDHPCPVSPI